MRRDSRRIQPRTTAAGYRPSLLLCTTRSSPTRAVAFLFVFFLFSSLIFYRFTVCVIAAALLSSVLSLFSLPLLLLGEPDR